MRQSLCFFTKLLLSMIILIGCSRSSESDNSPDTKPQRVNQLSPVNSAANKYWPQWRGPFNTGAAPDANPPVKWSESKNIRWKLALPGKGHSTPIIWGERIFVTAAIGYGDKVSPTHDRPGSHDNLSAVQHQKFIVLAVSRRKGKIIWQKILHQDVPHEGGYHTASFASNSPVTDGKHILAFFGSQGLYCLDLDGKLQWQKDFGKMQSKHGHGEGSSPALYGNTVIVNWDHEKQSFVVALDKQTGKQIWKVERDEPTSWATPIVVEHNGKPQVIISGTTRIRGYDLFTGKVVWECGGLSHNVVASPVAAEGIVYAGSSYGKKAMLAIRLDGAKGDITGTNQVVWAKHRHTPYVPSPLLYHDKLYFLRHFQGVLTCLEAKTGKTIYGPARLPGIFNVYASPVAAAGRLYITARDGVTLVLNHSNKLEVLAENRLDDTFSASSAIIDDTLFLRGEKYLYCIAKVE